MGILRTTVPSSNMSCGGREKLFGWFEPRVAQSPVIWDVGECHFGWRPSWLGEWGL